jgi:hypothetical protein
VGLGVWGEMAKFQPAFFSLFYIFSVYIRINKGVTMDIEASVKSFLGWIVAGMGFHVGWGLIQLIINLLSGAVGK